MNISAKIIEMLNESPKAKALLNTFNEAATKANLTDDEYSRLRETHLMLAMTLVPETMTLMANELYEEFNGAQ